jgi:SPP1 gp7 family putative phage head morphogenesis protein
MSSESKQMFKNQLIIQKALNPKKKLKAKPMKKLLYPTAKERVYYKYIRSIIKSYVGYVNEVMIPKLESWSKELKRVDSVGDEIEFVIQGFDDIDDLIFVKNREQLEKTIKMTGTELNEQSEAQFKALLKASTGIEVATTNLWADDFVKMFTKNNISLISGLSEEYIKKINNTVMTGLQKGSSSSKIASELRQINENFTGARSRLIARDQIGKFWGDVNRKRQNDIGANYYIWRTVTDERVRESHAAMEGKLCDWNDSSIYSNDKPGDWNNRSSIGGVKLDPGEDYQCRCYAEPYLDDILKDLEN